MGLISGLLGLPLAPVRGTVAAAEQILEHAEEQYYDAATIRAQLDEVERQREAGELTDEEATAWEDELVDRLVEGHNRLRRK
ncbi:MAG: gas vesicle protein GvpG [Actinomycetes bacterium]